MIPELRPNQHLNAALISTLRDEATTLGNVRSGFDVGLGYTRECPEVYARLKHAISEPDLEQLIYTRGHERLYGGPLDTPEARLMASGELDKMIEQLNLWADSISKEIDFWGPAGTIVVPDTNIFLHALPDAGAKIDDPDWWRTQAEIRPEAPFTIVLLSAVIKELDEKKDRGDTRSIARWTLKRLNSLIGVTSQRERRPLSSDDPRAWVTWLPEALHHRRLPDADSEIIDRSLALDARVPGRLVVLTRDTGLALRSTHVALDCRLTPFPDT